MRWEYISFVRYLTHKHVQHGRQVCKRTGISLLRYWKNNIMTTTRNYSAVIKTEDISSKMYIYVVGSKIFRPEIQKPRQMENAVRDI